MPSPRLLIGAALLSACHRPPPGPQTLVLVVLDTLRADHSSACGYERPTTPFLAELRQQAVASTCAAISPAPWTLPTHASWFTGLDVPTHGVQFVEGGVDVAGQVSIRPLDPAFETLAERLAADGWSTALVSGNAALNPTSGLTQGFDTVRVARAGDHDLRGDKLVEVVQEVLSGVSGSRRLLLVVNIFDAHDPYPAIGPRHPWLPPHPRLPLRFTDADSEYVRFHRGALTPDESKAFLTRAVDTYDHGMERADATLRGVWDALRASGRLDAEHRVIVTADHGELLGEHERMRHGGHLWEPLLRVPLLVLGSGTADLSGEVSSLEVHPLLRDGRRPEPPAPLIAWSEQVGAHPDHGIDGAVWYQGGDKQWWVEGRPAFTVHLGSDPAELRPEPAQPAPALVRAAEALRTTRDRPVTGGMDAEALRALGYAR